MRITAVIHDEPRLRVEEADHALSDELFGGAGGNSTHSTSSSKAAASSSQSAAAGLEGVPLKTLQEHVKLALELRQKLRYCSAGWFRITIVDSLLLLRMIA